MNADEKLHAHMQVDENTYMCRWTLSLTPRMFMLDLMGKTHVEMQVNEKPTCLYGTW